MIARVSWRVGRLGLLLLAVLASTACQGGLAWPRAKERPVPDLANVRANLAFTCAYEKDAIPPRDPEADQLFKHARWLFKNNKLKRNPEVYPKVERLYRIATAYGHDKANFELRNMIGNGTAFSDNPMKETLDLTEDLIKRGIPGGYYDMGFYLEKGSGVKQDAELSRKYFRKSADLGSPDGQYVVAEWLAPIDIAPDIARQMRRCAAEQGHGKAALALGVNLQNTSQSFNKNLYTEALQAFQMGVKAGDDGSASFLYHGFNGPKPDDQMYYLGQTKDEERARRYKAIGSMLGGYSYLNPKVPEIDQIVPLPPAKLPPWDGKLKWVEEHKANVPPPLPSEGRIAEMAKAKGLDPETGRPLKKKVAEATPAEPQPVAAAPAVNSPLGLQLATGATCPQTGTWACSTEQGGSRRVFMAGETFTGVRLAAAPSLWQKMKGEEATQVVDTTWTLVEVPEGDKA